MRRRSVRIMSVLLSDQLGHHRFPRKKKLRFQDPEADERGTSSKKLQLKIVTKIFFYCDNLSAFI